ncbi:MAG: ATP:cob(I)alamin adenosyltransferase [Clostridium sp.]|uniref:ATP:cob(I)alamin adenosyltransferase n=1 Tax=Clostridium innocuum TaxID=1522 RepID=UPI001AFAE945|nr:ATP:cob(I)alamin adenosyltransferase [[Clostridium] innocuum]QSI24679.1 ATP:cob(I)alamin adenosyltransferase [Erysipelotrichaceae bacterium 66202529]MCC2832293.1 ATP:cob(I)alamin adenosyltransferase [[Clostridium] innocuum]MCR0246470.1 ATP:cob(I)alamin adenosyltransferase [[Clostridium] innocuum]MCR0260297.1 ATP:cob(I)alamin adenosyltransferase [[Clostridium] innocuum]MCR0392432.1 ATP:cob(I)alamin adenosyltransferase [[Clostridium] innocuum]
MSVEYCAYPFLKEESNLCDYEIATDRLASMLSVARHHIRHIPQEDLLQLMEMIYHANGSIRGNCAIRDIELQKLNILYARYSMHMDHFVLPDGCIGASYLHVLRAETKAVIRIMHRIQQEGKTVEAVLFDFMNLLSNTFFMLCLYENKHDGFLEREFISRSYV